MSSDNTSEFTFSQLYNIYKLNKKKIWINVAIFTALVLAFSFIKPYKYESNTSVMPPSKSEMSGLSSILQSVSGSIPSGISLGGLSSKGSDSQLFAEILKSRSLAIYLIDSLKLNKLDQLSSLTRMELIQEVQKMINVDVLRNGLLVISTSLETGYFPSSKDKDSTALLAAKIATISVGGLDKIIIERNTSSAKKSRQYVERELINYRSKLDSIDQILETFQKTNNVLKIEDQTQALVKQAIEVGTELAKAQLELNVALTEYSANSSMVNQLRSKVKELQKQYELVQSGGLTGTDGFSIPFSQIPNLARQYTNIFREKKIFEQVILYLETQKHQEAIQESRDVPVVQSLDDAYVPEKQSSPSKPLMLILGFVLSFVFSVLYYILKAVYIGTRKERIIVE